MAGALHDGGVDPVKALSKRGGIARVRALAQDGVTRHGVRVALEARLIQRPARGWLCLPDTDALLRSAAEVGVVLTCVTVAKRHALWTDDIEVAHVGIRPNGSLLRAAEAHVHWAKPVIARDGDALEDQILNALVILAVCQPYEHGLAAWEGAMRRGLLDVEMLRGLSLPPDARRLLEDAQPYADEGTESVLLARLRRLRLDVPMYRQVVLCGRPVDLLIGERLVIQVDGGTHVGAQRAKDNEHDTLLALRGYHVIRITYGQLMDDWPRVQTLILTAIAQGLHRARR